MSKASKITLVLTSLSAVGIIYGVHYVQEAEQQSMYQGVIKDKERQRIKHERAEELRLQQALQKEYEAIQPVAARPKG
ncbi:hypothetical protein POJ06DRAFT_267689 [Lipomyces tetrasporus]|uniref:Cytochrome c oxidase assembly protein n=1 Tax=Lipomyces tetrasporus TaxID=54092 RepID=A0AAD7QUI1_9ASCO|nr:uncharacterized protein POJ06DRAFT_267689 [Lipomyces tetrasporus]KAJ8101538.1 hypothetical protein POJ06DRAFT_267689 [Lipomyces tetrasporus]